MKSTVIRWLHPLGPVAMVPRREAVRSAVGAAAGLTVVALVAALMARVVGPAHSLMLIPPFGATAVLIFAAPNSPLAQPWPAVVGSAVSALVGLAVAALVPWAWLAGPLAVGLAIAAMALCRATHPPGGAVALMIVLTQAQHPSVFSVISIAAGTALIAMLGAGYARATGRRYPLRHVQDPSRVGTADPDPVERTGLSEDELASILVRYRQSLNLGVEDLARLIAAAEIEAAGHRTGRAVAADIMSRDLVTVAPDAPLREVAAVFVRHGFTALPVTGPDGRFHGVIFQLHLLSRLGDAADRGRGSPARAVRRLLGPAARAMPGTASAVMDAAPVTAGPQTPLSALLAPLAISGIDAIPIIEGDRLVGIVTQTDLIAALAMGSIGAAPQDAGALSLSAQKP